MTGDNHPNLEHPLPLNRPQFKAVVDIWRVVLGVSLFAFCILFICGILLVCLLSVPKTADAQMIPGTALTLHFTTHEFACHHCGKVKVSPDLIAHLEVLRFWLGSEPVIVTSGYRCPCHNKAVGGVKHSQHINGLAADIRVKGCSPEHVAKIAKKCGFKFVKKYKSWVHVDMRRGE